MSPDQWLAHLQRKLAAQAQAAGVYRDYYDGQHRLAFATSKFREAFGSLFSAFADNWCQIVVDAAAERLTVQGFRFGPGDGGDERAWEIWQANGLDAESIKGHTEAVKCGRAYLLASPASEGTTGLPVVTVEHPSQVVLECAPGRRRDRLAALKTWTDLDGRSHATLYLPRSIHRYQSAAKGNPGSATWEAVDGGGANPAGVVPVVALENNPDLLAGGRSDLQPIVRMQDAINKLCSDMLVSSEYNAFRQRYATGLEIPVDEETGQPIPGADLKAGMSRLMVSADPDTRFGEFSETTLAGYIAAIRLLVTHVAAQTRTPPHYVLGEIVNASGDALKSAETGLAYRVRRKQIDFSDPWEDVMRIAFLLDGDKARAGQAQAEVVWRDAEARSEGEVVDALTKLRTLGVPLETVWAIYGFSPQEIARMKNLAGLPDRPPPGATTAAASPPAAPPPPAVPAGP